MERRMGLLALAALFALAGCAAPKPLAETVVPADDVQVFAIRVEPFTNVVDWHGVLVAKACDPTTTAPCRYPVVGAAASPVGFDIAPQDNVFQEARGLFWRIQLNATWHSEPVQRPITVAWAMIRADGSVSRELGNKTGTSNVDFPQRDIFLLEGETGIRLRVDVGDQYPFAVGKGIEFHVQGVVQAYLPASAPVLLK